MHVTISYHYTTSFEFPPPKDGVFSSLLGQTMTESVLTCVIFRKITHNVISVATYTGKIAQTPTCPIYIHFNRIPTLIFNYA